MNFAHMANDGSEVNMAIKQQVARTADWQKSKNLSSIEHLFSPIALKQKITCLLIQNQDFCNKKIPQPSQIEKLNLSAA